MIIGSSKTTSLFEKVNTTSLRSLDYGDSKPLVTKPLPAASGSNKNGWFDLEVKYPIQARIDDVERISKLLVKVQGIKWEGHTAALQTIQNNLEDHRSHADSSTMAARSGANRASWLTRTLGASLGDTLKNAGKALVTTLGLTASTLVQVAADGLGEHQEPLLERSYLKKTTKDGTFMGSTVLASLGFGGGDNYGAAGDAKEGLKVDMDTLAPEYSFLKKKDDASYEFGRVQNSEFSSIEDESKDLTITTQRANAAVPVSTMEKTYETHKAKWKGREEVTSTITENGVLSQLLFPHKADNILSVSRLEKDYSHVLAYATGSNAIRVEKFNVEQSDFEHEFSLIPFEICSIAANSKRRMLFQANLDSYDDSYSADWQSTSYVGRADKFYTYGGFTRDINFSFKAVALVQTHLIPLYRGLNLLAATTAPDYGRKAGYLWYYDRTKPYSSQSAEEQKSNANQIDYTGYIESGSFNPGNGSLEEGDDVFMRGTISRITIGDLLYKQYGIIKSVKFSWDVDVPWEISYTTIRVPHVLNVSISFTPIHNFVPTADVASYFGNIGRIAAGDTTEGSEEEALDLRVPTITQ